MLQAQHCGSPEAGFFGDPVEPFVRAALLLFTIVVFPDPLMVFVWSVECVF